MKVDSMEKKRKRHLGVIFGLICLSLAYLDTKGYRDALEGFSNAAQPQSIKADLETTSKDVQAVMKCRDTQGGQTSPPDQKWRDCMISALLAIRSENGAIVGVIKASSWLKKHPTDDDMRRAAKTAMFHGWAAYKRSLPLYIAQQRVIDARRESFILRLVDGGGDTGSLVDFRFENLREIEAKIVASSV